MPARSMLWAGMAMTLVELHGPGQNGQRIFVNPHEVTSIREPRALAHQHLAPGTHCVLFMVSGNFISVAEPCDDVRNKLVGTPP
jgi:uncharacterized protein YlzI (FlbEa/FlbD family)